jgi:hypothetical protein
MRTIRPSHANRVIVLAATLVLVLAACGSGASAPQNGDGGFDDNGGGRPAAAAPTLAPAPAAGDGVGAPIDDARIIRTGTIDLEVTDVAAAVRAARDAIRGLGGYIGASATYARDDYPYAEVTYRIPGDRWEDALDALRNLGGLTKKVAGEQTQAVEVTGQVIDLEARIANLRAGEASLQEIASRATRISDVLEVQAQLTSIRGQIEQLEAQRKDLEDRAAFATLTASFQVQLAAVELASKGWDPGAVVDEASGSLISILQAITAAGIWFAIVWLPLLLVVAVIVAVGVWIARRTGFRRPARSTPEV